MVRFILLLNMLPLIQQSLSILDQKAMNIVNFVTVFYRRLTAKQANAVSFLNKLLRLTC